MAVSEYILQHVADESPGIYGASVEGTKATEAFILRPTDVDADIIALLLQAFNDILGESEASGTGRLSRSLPVCHPLLGRHVVATAITNIRGVGDKDPKYNRFGQRIDVEAFPNGPQPILGKWWVYPLMKFSVEFSQVPYQLWDDVTIEEGKETVTWYDQDGTVHTNIAMPEWTRFAFWREDSAMEVRFNQLGQLVFRRGDATGPLLPSPNGFTFAGHPKLFVPTTAVVCSWFRVPLSWVEGATSRLAKYTYTINQFKFAGCERGSLRYDGYKITNRFTPPVPDYDPWLDVDVKGPEKLCNVDLMFSLTQRTVPAAAVINESQVGWNKNYVAAGWNLEYFFGDKKPYYVTNADPPPPAVGPGTPLAVSKWVPLYFSYPFELLFSDPAM